MVRGFALPFGFSSTDVLALAALGIAGYGVARGWDRFVSDGQAYEPESRTCRLCGYDLSPNTSKCSACNARVVDEE